MRQIDVMNINMHQIQMFLAVARLGNITNAAQYLNVSQSTLSKNIQKLEQELDLVLFIRKKQTAPFPCRQSIAKGTVKYQRSGGECNH